MNLPEPDAKLQGRQALPSETGGGGGVGREASLALCQRLLGLDRNMAPKASMGPLSLKASLQGQGHPEYTHTEEWLDHSASLK
jgi:hypothetical protein